MEPIDPTRLLYLITGFNAGRLSSTEQAELDSWVAPNEENRERFHKLTNKTQINREIGKWQTEDTENALLRVNGRIERTEQNGSFITLRRIAAVLFILAGLSISYYYFGRNPQKQNTIAQTYAMAEQIAAATDRATLTLSDGSKIDLTSAKSGLVAKQAALTISKNSDGQLIYTASANEETKEATNTIETPRAGRFQVQLNDGTRVWLNAASKLTYNTAMSTAKERVVQLSGEAYFEVAHDSKRPFFVKTATQQIKVLGTHFNVNSYGDNPISNTTLLEGSVQVSNDGQQKIMKPGEMASVKKGFIVVEQTDTDLAIAWKDGHLQFRDVPLKDMMKMVSRWYDIDVAYEAGVPNELFSGKLPKGSKLSVLLKVLEASNIHFAMEQDKGSQQTLIIKP